MRSEAGEGLLVQPQPGGGKIAGDDLEALLGQFPEARRKLRVQRAEGLVQPPPRVLCIAGSDDAGDRAALARQMLKPFEAEEPAKEPGRAGEQDMAGFGGGRLGLLCRFECGGIEEGIER